MIGGVKGEGFVVLIEAETIQCDHFVQVGWRDDVVAVPDYTFYHFVVLGIHQHQGLLVQGFGLFGNLYFLMHLRQNAHTIILFADVGVGIDLVDGCELGFVFGHRVGIRHLLELGISS